MPGFAPIGSLALGALPSSGPLPPIDIMLTDGLAFTDDTLTDLVNALVERLSLTTSTEALRNALVTLTESLGLTERIRIILEATATDGLALADATEATRSALAAIIDGLVLSGSATGTMTAIQTITEALALSDVLRSVQEGDITEALSLLETIEARLSAYETLVSAAVFTDSAVGAANVTVLITEDFQLSETLTPIASFIAVIQEGLDFSIGFTFDDTPYLGLSMNAANKALSTYSNYPFNSLANFNGKTYAASSEGLYELGGDTDAGEQIVWRLRTGMNTLGTGRNKGMDSAYIGFTATGRIALKCIIINAAGEKIVHWYELTPAKAGGPRPGRITMGRGLRSVYWGFELTNVDAGDIALDVIELHPIILDGRL